MFAEGEDEFFFGLATAPAHVEDRLNDAWLQFAEEDPDDKSESQGELQTTDAITGSASGDGGSQPVSLSGKATKTDTKRKPLKIAMEAMIRGYEKYIEGDGGEEEEVEKPVPDEDCQHNVAAWHNVVHP